MFLQLFCEVFEESHCGGVRDDEIRVVRGGERPASALRVDGLDGQPDALNRRGLVRATVKIDEILQPRPHLGGLPILAHAHQRGHDGGQSRGLVSGQVLLRVAAGLNESAPVSEQSSQDKLAPVAGRGKAEMQRGVFHFLIICRLIFFKNCYSVGNSSTVSDWMALVSMAENP